MNRYRIISPPPPPVGTAAKLLSPGPILLFLLPMAALLTGCPSPGGGGTYTTIVSGRITTPAGKAVTQYDTAAVRSVASSKDAEVTASTDSSVKAAVAADGRFTLRVKHPGTFTLSVDYPAGRDYKAGAPQSVRTTKAAHTQDIALKYGYTTTLSGQVIIFDAGGSVSSTDDVPVIIKVEGRETARTDSRTIGGSPGSYRIKFDHPGTFRASASFEGRTGTYAHARYTDAALTTGSIVVRP